MAKIPEHISGGELMLTQGMILLANKTGDHLDSRINLLSLNVCWAIARLESRHGDKNNDHKTLIELMEQINGKPCPKGGCEKDGILYKYTPGMDSPTELEYNIEDKNEIQGMLNWHILDLVRIIDRNYLVSREAIEGVDMTSSNRQRYKE